VCRYVTIPLIAALSPVHCDINRFHLWSPIATRNHLDRPERIPNVAQTTGTVDVFDPRSGISGPTVRRASACPDIHEMKGKENKTNFRVSKLDEKIDTCSTKCLQLT
jgi:hypothetical protein